MKKLTNKHIVRTSLIILLFGVIAYFLNFFVNAMLAEWLDAKYFGDYSAGINALMVTSIIILVGMDKSVLRFYPEYISTGNWEEASGFLRHNFKIIICISLTVFVLGLLLGLILYKLHIREILLFEQSHPFYLFVLGQFPLLP